MSDMQNKDVRKQTTKPRLGSKNVGVASNATARKIRKNAGTEPSGAATSGLAAAVRSIKCVECGKIFNNRAEMQFHAAKTKHNNFTETTEQKPPLSAEERNAQIKFLEEKIKQRRLERAEHERINAQKQERDRIRKSRELSEARRRKQELEMKEIIVARKRERDNEFAARDRVRAQIEADKAERKARDHNQNTTTTTTTTTRTQPLTSTSPRNAAAKPTQKDYIHTHIQIRLLDGSTVTEKFHIEDLLSAVRAFIELNTGITTFNLMTSFPRKVFVDEDYERSLKAMGLVPTAVLIMTK